MVLKVLTHSRFSFKGIRGNGHMVMIEKNSLELAGHSTNWIRKNIK